MTSHEIALTFAEKFQREYPNIPIYKLMEELRIAIDEYAQQQVKNCDLADVSGSSLPLKIERVVVVAAQRWGKDYPGSTVGIIGRDAIEICKQYDIDWENYR